MSTQDHESAFKLLSTQLAKENAEALRPVIRQEIKSLVENQKKEDERRYIPSDEAKAMLNVCDSSLWRWNKKGLLTKRKISGRTYYDRVEILKLLNNPM